VSLREELAEHLSNRWGKAEGFTPTPVKFAKFSELYQQHWLHMADEVIRLMDWARKSSLSIKYEFDTPPASISYYPMTLPTEDWQP
jgi:hypothetical protein